MSKISRLALVALLPALAACGARRSPVLVVNDPDPVPVSIEVEVYDPVTNFVWQDVGVRVVDSYQEWSDTIVESPYFDFWQYTDPNGLAFFDECWLGDADVGFIEDRDGCALLLPDRFEDQATVLLELDGVGFQTQYYEVDLSWDVPDVFVSLPF